MRPLPDLSLTDVSEAIRTRAVSPVEVTAEALERIGAHDRVLKSFITVLHDRAMAQARTAEAEIMRGFWRGPLHGVPIGLKDLCYTTFAPSSAGMHIHRNFVPPHNATVVDRLEAAGAVTLGKLAMTEGAFAGHHPLMPTPLNPWAPDHWTGSSSSGSGAATAAGFCYGSLGSDTGGSIRFPSGACGLTGLKPTWGRVSRYGVFALADSLDHIGPMTRTAADAAAMLGVIAGADPLDPTTLTAPVPDYLAGLGAPIRGLRIGLAEAYVFEGLDAEVGAVLRGALAALESLGARTVPIGFPDWRHIGRDWGTFCGVETAIAHEATYPSRADQYGEVLAGFIDGGLKVSALDLGKVLIERAKLAGHVGRIFDAVDVMIVPVLPTLVPKIADWDQIARQDISELLRYTAPFDMTGSPTITLNGGFDRNGVPIGFQLVGPHLSEALLLRAGHAFQQVTDFHTRHPDLGRLPG